MIVVSDTTPLISLLKIGRLDLLRTLFGEVHVPAAVFGELTQNPRFKDEAEQVRSCPFLKVGTADEERDRRDIEIINANADYLNAGAEENLEFQADIWEDEE